VPDKDNVLEIVRFQVANNRIDIRLPIHALAFGLVCAMTR
jgi:hypothetical protein